MSYRCDRCNKVANGRELKYISEIRDVSYKRKFVRFDKREKKKVSHTNGLFKGFEIVTEQRLCKDCYESVKDSDPKICNKNKYINFVGKKRRDSSSFQQGTKTELDLKGLKDKLEGRR